MNKSELRVHMEESGENSLLITLEVTHHFIIKQEFTFFKVKLNNQFLKLYKYNTIWKLCNQATF